MVKSALKLTLFYCYDLERRKFFWQPKGGDSTLEIANSENLLWHLWLTEIFALALVAIVGVFQWGDGMMIYFRVASWVAIQGSGHC